MKLPEREVFVEELQDIKNEEIKQKSLILYDSIISFENIGQKQLQLADQIIEGLFNSQNLYYEPIIPLSFFQTSLGKLILIVLNDESEQNYTINALIELTKTKDKPQGLTKQYISQEIKAGRLKAIKESGVWKIPSGEAKRYLAEKGLI